MVRWLVGMVVIAGCAGQVTRPEVRAARFEFHSGAWINLHHVLWGEALRRSTPDHGRKDAVPEDVDAAVLEGEDAQRWSAAIDVYVARFAGKDFTFDDEMAALNGRLSALEDAADVRGSGVAAEAAEALAAVMPIYRARWWPAHDRANRAWSEAVAAQLARHGEAMSRELARIYQAGWPAAPLRVDVVHYAGWSGAYTTLGPDHLTVASGDPRNQGVGALEIVLHEASHAVVAPLRDALDRELAARGKRARDLWHATLFFSVGDVVRRGVPGYVPYADRLGLYARAWPAYRAALVRAWAPYLAGRATFADAVRALVAALPAG
jgi:hypothetical protein